MKPTHLSYLLFIAVLVVLLAPAYAVERHVYPGQSIQSAIDECNEGDVVIIHPSTQSPPVPYYENLIISECSITLMSVDPNDADIVQQTIIDGGGQQVRKSAIRIKQADINRHGRTSSIYGLTIQNGYAVIDEQEDPNGVQLRVEDPNFCGGGICVERYDYSVPEGVTVSNCIIIDNEADKRGGGLYGVHRVVNSTITNNQCLSTIPGGSSYGMSIYGTGGGLAECGLSWGLISGCIIDSNTAWHGGGIADSNSLSNCIIKNNKVMYFRDENYNASTDARGAGLYICRNITNCLIKDNSILPYDDYPSNMSQTFGGGLHLCTNVNKCEIVGNEALVFGGGIAACNSVKDCVISGNSAVNPDPNGSNPSAGGGVYHCGGDITGPTPPLQNCIVADNIAAIGGGVYDTVAENCWITGNEATLLGGGLLQDQWQLVNELPRLPITARNCLITDNVAGKGGGIAGSLILTNCAIFGNQALDYPAGYGADIIYDHTTSGAWTFDEDEESLISIVNSMIFENKVKDQPPSAQANYINICYIGYSGFPATCGMPLPGDNNISDLPLFLKDGLWNDNGTPTYFEDDYWTDGDYHLAGDNGYVDSGNDQALDPEDWRSIPIDFDYDNNKRVNSSVFEPNQQYFADRGAFEMIDGPVLKYIKKSGVNVWDPNIYNPYGELLNGAYYVPSASNNMPGHIRTALKLDGFNDYVEVEDFTGVADTNERTCMAWVKADPSSNYSLMVMGWGEWQQGQAWYIGIKNDYGGPGRLAVGIYGAWKAGTTNLMDGTWHHVAAVVPFKSAPTIADVLLYVDGNLEVISGFYNQSQQIDTVLSNRLLIGAIDQGQPGCYFKGLIDEAWVIDRALTQDAIRTGVLNQWHDNDRGTSWDRPWNWWNGDNQKPLCDSRVAHWRMDEGYGITVHDSTANAYHATLLNFDDLSSGGTRFATAASGKWQDGINVKALKFDGVDDHIVARQFNGIGGSAPRTIAAWIKPDGRLGDSNPLIIASWGSLTGPNWYVGLKRDYGDGTARFGVGSCGNYIIGATNLMDGKWHHVTAVLPFGSNPTIASIELYVDGQPESIGEVNNPSYAINTESTPVLIGAFNLPDSCWNFYKGMIDDLSVYDRGLADHEVWALVTEPSELYLKLDEGALTTDQQIQQTEFTHDSNPANHDAILLGFDPNHWVYGHVSGGLMFNEENVCGGTLEGSTLAFNGINGVYYSICGTDSRTCMALIKPSQIGSIMKWGDSDVNGQRWALGLVTDIDDSVKLSVDIGGFMIKSSIAVPLNQWSHVTVVFTEDSYSTAENIRLYINGQDATPSITEKTILLNTKQDSSLVIGGQFEPDGVSYTGIMDEVRIYNRALPSEEVGRICADYGL